jgi:hypothetical protein
LDSSNFNDFTLMYLIKIIYLDSNENLNATNKLNIEHLKQIETKLLLKR